MLTLGGEFAALDGNGEVVLDAASVAGVMPTSIAVEGTLGPTTIDAAISVTSARSARIDIAVGAALHNYGSIIADGAALVAGDSLNFELDGHFDNLGQVVARNGAALTLTGEWENNTGASIAAQDTSLLLLGDWLNLGQIDVANGSVELTLAGPPWIDWVPGDLNLVNSTATLDGEFFSDALSDVTADATSVVELRGDIIGGTLDLDALPTSFTLGPGAQVQSLTVSGATPLFANGGSLSFVDLHTDLLVRNGATVTVDGDIDLEGANIVQAADDAITTLSVSAGTITGNGKIRFAGTAPTDTRNTIALDIGYGLHDTPGPALRAVSSGGRIAVAEFFPLTLAGDVDVGLVGRRISLGDGDVFLGGDVHIGAGATLEVNGDLIFQNGSAHELTVDIGGPASVGRIANSGLDLIDASGIPVTVDFVNGFVPSECDSFGIVTGFNLNGQPFGPVSGPPLGGGLGLVLEYRFESVDVRVQGAVPCP